MTPFWDPNFSPPSGQLAAPFLYSHGKSGPKSKSYSQISVLGPASYPVSCWPCPDRVNHPWI